MLGGGAPQYEREYKEPGYLEDIAKFNIDDVNDIESVARIKISSRTISTTAQHC